MIFLANGTVAAAATKTALIIGSTANIRPRILKYDVSTDGTPTSDQGIKYNVSRATALGTTTAQTLAAADPSDTSGSPVVTAGITATVEPTYSGTAIHTRAQNPRATYTWQAYSPDAELICPATAANGIGWQMTALGGAAGNFLVNCDVRQ
jgi:hypothetical protein